MLLQPLNDMNTMLRLQVKCLESGFFFPQDLCCSLVFMEVQKNVLSGLFLKYDLVEAGGFVFSLYRGFSPNANEV